MPHDNDVVIVSAVRTPLCRARKGALASTPPSTLLEICLKALPITNVDDVCVGNVLLPPSSFAALRMTQLVALNQEMMSSSSFSMVNRQCASGLEAIAKIAHAVHAGSIRSGIGAGVESMSLTPMHTMKLLDGVVDWKRVQNSTVAMDCLMPMGLTSEAVVQKYGLERHVLDQFAVQSHQKASFAQRNKKFSAIVPVGSVTADDGIRPETTLQGLSTLKPAFLPTGITTAGNSSQMTDGAAAVLLMTRAEARVRKLPVQAVWRGYTAVGVPPSIMGIGPAVAIPKVLQQTGLSVQDIDVYEINEAFASQAVWCIRELGLDESKVNPNGGAIALGHPLGATGARMVADIIPELHRRKGRYGVVSMCVGTGMGAAAVLEVEPTASL